MLTKVGIGAVAGIVVSIGAAMALDAVWPTGSSKNKSLALVGLAGLAAVFLGGRYPVIATGIATGMVLVPGQQLVAGLVSSGGATASAPQIADGTSTGALYASTREAGLGALYSNAKEAGLAALHEGQENYLAAQDEALLRAKGVL